MRRDEVKKRDLMEELAGELSDLAGQIDSEFKNEIGKKMALLVEKTKVDFEEFLQKIDLLQDEADINDYQNIFFSLWCKKAPILNHVIDEMIEKHDSFSAKLAKDHILSMGAKAKAVLSGFCVSSTIEVDCKTCYFSSICKSKKE